MTTSASTSRTATATDSVVIPATTAARTIAEAMVKDPRLLHAFAVSDPYYAVSGSSKIDTTNLLAALRAVAILSGIVAMLIHDQADQHDRDPLEVWHSVWRNRPC